MANKKSQSISLNTIIVAAIALVVLIVMILIFTGKIRVFGEGIEDCGQRGGECKEQVGIAGKCQQENNQDVYATIKNTNCEKNTPPKVCCVRVL